MDPRQHAVPRDGEDPAVGRQAPGGDGHVQGGETGPHQQHLGAGAQPLDGAAAPGIVLHHGLDLVAAVEQQRARPGPAGGQHEDVRGQPLARRQADGPPLGRGLGGLGRLTDDPDAIGLQPVQPRLEIVAEQGARREVVGRPALRPRRVGGQPTVEILGRAALERHVPDAGV